MKRFATRRESPGFKGVLATLIISSIIMAYTLEMDIYKCIVVRLNFNKNVIILKSRKGHICKNTVVCCNREYGCGCFSC